MATKGKQIIVTYYGLDGACAAAVALSRYPKAELVTTSARRIGETLRGLSSSNAGEVHVCGVGVYCDWREVEEACRVIKKRGGKVFWHCGRGYLDGERERFATFCTPVFIEADTNTGALAKHLQMTNDVVGALLSDLAVFDHNISGAKQAKKATPEQEKWIDLVAAAISLYFKYQDEGAYRAMIPKLVSLDLGVEDERTVEVFRNTRFKYVLHGRSGEIRKLRERIKKCGEVDRPLIIMGESGVGKEHVAQLVREASRRRDEAFIPINCALYAGSASLANSDLFGHVKGAFTGADAERQGRLVAASKGILYLDEVGELPMEVQAKLLRVFEDGWVTPEGADRPTHHVDVRIIAATNRDLPNMVRAGKFRADLYHRLSTLRLYVPPLRERMEDIRIILEERLDLLRGEGHDRALSRNDYEILKDYDWPGNVRQLIKLIERAFYLEIPIREAMEEEKALGDLRTADESTPSSKESLLPRSQGDVMSLEEVKRLYAKHVWDLFDHNTTAAARALEITPNTLRYSYLGEKEG